MSKRTLTLTIVLACALLGTFGIIYSKTASFATGATKNTALKHQNNNRSAYEQDLKSVEALKEAKDLKGLARLADEIESKWATLNKDYYASLMVEVVGAFSGYDLKDDRLYALALKYAKAALEKGDWLPLEAEIKLVRFLEGGPEYTTGQIKAEEWARDRSERISYWLHAWQRLEKEINRNFDFDNRPRLNVLPPAGYGPAGIAPESIKDSKARAEYESAIAANKENIAEYNKQWVLHQLDKYFTPHAMRFIVEAYSKPPYNLEELRKHLGTNIVDKGVKKRLLDEVTKNIGKP